MEIDQTDRGEEAHRAALSVNGDEADDGGGSVVDGAVAPVLPRASGGDDEVRSGASNSKVATTSTRASSGSGEARPEFLKRRRAFGDLVPLQLLRK